ncbi:hypothetical protein ABFU84_02160 [Xanthomonas translucens pv. undulosa]|uniref:hypothetical protein n=1 Tax=Xanthomonas campestris pv. translucens TaxID=343 RepID=UPI003CE8FD84
MALINRIEVVNYLCEGWQPSMGIATWKPLWPANVIHLCGASTAVQVPNGCGKTSVTSAILYLLSRDRILKQQFLERCAPAGLAASHIRIEFAILVEEDLIQRDLMTRDPRACPAQTYVIGVCANRSDDSPRFYRYPGLLEDVPACRREGNTIEFSTTEALRTGVKHMRGGQWDCWNSIREWSQVVDMFMSPEVVRQNVQFHLEGAGDASAAFSKVKAGPGERFDEAYFRQVVAPQLLSNVMGEAAEEGERNIEDTILNSMNRFIDAKLDVEKKRGYLERREALEGEFRPVIEAAGKIQLAQTEYQTQLQRLAVNAAFLARFTQSPDARMPGVPRPLDELALDPKVRDCLQSMVLDKDGSLLIESSGLAGLLVLSTGHLNQLAARSSTTRVAVIPSVVSSQAIDFYCDIKISEGHGGRRKAMLYYDLAAALELVVRRSESGSNQVAILEDAFEVAKSRVDTNPFRHVHHRLSVRLTQLKAGVREAEAAGAAAEQDKERLEQQVKDRQENQGAYQAFCAHLYLLPTDLHNSPIQVQGWLATENKRRTDAVSDHVQRVGQLTTGWEEFRKVREDLGLMSVEDRIRGLRAERDLHEGTTKGLQSDVGVAQSAWNETTKAKQNLQAELSEIGLQYGLLSGHAQAYDTFIALFGDVNPMQVGPPSAEKRQLDARREQLTGQHRIKSRELESVQELAAGAMSFKELFGDVDPRQAAPQQEYEALLNAKRTTEILLAQNVPLADSFDAHVARTAQDPSMWMEAADLARATAQQDERIARDALVAIDRELSALENLDLVGSADYAAAHEVLRSAGAQATRVRDVILGLSLPKEKTLPLLAAFGSLLDAPVTADVNTAEIALAALHADGHDIPLLLLEPLVEALGRGSNHETSAAASLLFMAGPKSRRIRAMVDPQALQEERQGFLYKREMEVAKATNARSKAMKNSPDTEDYRLALRAQEATRRGSVDKVNAAKEELVVLDACIAAMKPLVSPAALSFLEKAENFINAGGYDVLVTLSTSLEALTSEIAALDERLAKIAPLLTDEVIVAHDGACKFVSEGGYDTLESLDKRQAALRQQRSDLEGEALVLEAKLTHLREEMSRSQERERIFMASFTMTLERLSRVKAFEAEGSADFMEVHETRRRELELARDALDPLRSINYAGAQAFHDHQGQDEAELQKLIGEAKHIRQQAAEKARQLNAEAEGLEGELVATKSLAEALHELAHFLCARRQSVVPFERDLASRDTGPSSAESHPAYAMAEELRQRLLAWRPAQGLFDRAELSGLREEVEAIDVASAGKEVSEARRRAMRAYDHFVGIRNGFCRQARSSLEGGFSEAEIEAIEAASNAKELETLASIGDRLREQLQAEQSELEQLQNTTNTVEAASIETLTRLVETSRSNLVALNAVMEQNPKARFMIQADVISTEDIKKLMEDLRDHIEGRKREARARQSLIRSTIDTNIGADIRRALIDRIFIHPSVEFRHVGMWDGKQRPVQRSFSEGQKSALQMLWLIKESEYHLECSVRRHLGGGARKKLRSRAQRVLFFDGLFSNLTDRALIDEAFKGLGEADSSLQLIGLIHNPEYRNNFAIFPSFVIGRRVGRRDVEGQRTYVRFEDERPEGSMGLATFMQKRSPGTTDALQ